MQNVWTAPVLWLTNNTVCPSLATRAILSRHFCWNRKSPTASTSSRIRISGSWWIATENASREYMPVE